MLGDPTDGRLAHVTVVDGGAAEGVELTASERVVPVVVYDIDDPYTVNLDDFSVEVCRE